MGTASVIGNSTSGAAAKTAHDDIALVHACKRGDAAAFEQLVKRYDRRLLNIAQHVTHNREDAQDAVQEAFLKVFRKLTQFQENSQFSTWLIRITVNESLMKLRKQYSTREVPIDERFLDVARTCITDIAPLEKQPFPLWISASSDGQHLLYEQLDTEISNVMSVESFR
jgi:RNA polymerase sigma factor (sigma-70 family)